MAKRNFEGENITIIAGPTFGQAMKFVLLGAALGAGAVYYLHEKRNSPASTNEFSSDSFGETPDSVTRRVNNLAGRAKNMATRAKDLMQSAQENLRPALEEIVAEGKKAAAEFEAKVKKDAEAARKKAADEIEEV